MVEIQQSFAIPEYVTELTGFWGNNGEWFDYPSRKKWIKDNILYDGVKRLFACWCARSVLHRFESRYPYDNRPKNAIGVAERYAFGKARLYELRESRRDDADADADADAIYAAYSSADTTADCSTYAASYAADYAVHTFGAAARCNQSRALSLFTSPDFHVSETTIGLCRSWYESRDVMLIGLISDSLQDSDYPYDYRIEMMEENPECMAIGMWPLTPGIILGADNPHLDV